MTRPSARFFLVLISATSTLGIATYELAVLRPGCKHLAHLQEEILRRERSLGLASRLIADHPNVMRRLRSNEFGSMARFGISNPVVELMTRSAREHGLTLDLVEPGATVTAGPRKMTPISLHLSGEYPEFLAWLQEMETSDVLASVDQIFMEGAPTGRHLFRVTLSTYAYSATTGG